MADELAYKPPKASVGDAAHLVAKVAIGQVPLIGSGAAELFNAVIRPPLEKRKHTWMEVVGEGLRNLEQAGATIVEELASNEAFIDTLLQASNAAVRTSLEEKREALRNAVLNAALPHAPDSTRQQMFLNWVETLTVSHLRILKLLSDPRAWYKAANRQPPQWQIAGSLWALIANAFTELANEQKLCIKIGKDLYNAGLISTDGIMTNMSGDGPLEKRATDLGNELLRFITDPAADK